MPLTSSRIFNGSVKPRKDIGFDTKYVSDVVHGSIVDSSIHYTNQGCTNLLTLLNYAKDHISWGSASQSLRVNPGILHAIYRRYLLSLY